MEANLAGTNLAEAKLTEASLSGANVKGASLPLGGLYNKAPYWPIFEREADSSDGQRKVGEGWKLQVEYRTETLGEGVNLALVRVPGGCFQMGSPANEGRDNERPQHGVTVASFWMGKHPVTQAQWKAVASLAKVDCELDPDPSRCKGDNRPVERVTWYEANEFCKRLSRRMGDDYRLPSEAEWEYACRAAGVTDFDLGESNTIGLANYREPGKELKPTYPSSEGKGRPGGSCKETMEVGRFGVGNGFGVCDLHGNVWEWCLDHWHANYQGAPSDGRAWLSSDNSQYRIIRGSSGFVDPRICRAASRCRGNPTYRLNYIGFRVVCAAPKTLFHDKAG